MQHSDAIQTTGNATMDRSLSTIIAREDALFAAAKALGVSAEGVSALAVLRDAVGFLDLLSEGIARGVPFDCPEAAASFQWSIMKLVEFNGMLPEELRGDISPECFMPKTANAGEFH